MLLKSEVAELLLPSVFVNLAGRKDMDVDLHKIISSQVVFLTNFCQFPILFLHFSFKTKIFRNFVFCLKSLKGDSRLKELVYLFLVVEYAFWCAHCEHVSRDTIIRWLYDHPYSKISCVLHCCYMRHSERREFI